MKILWIVQKDLIHDLDRATWIEMAKALTLRNHQITLVTLSKTKMCNRNTLNNIEMKAIFVINRFPFIAITFHLQVMIFCLYWLIFRKPDILLTHPITGLFVLPSLIIARVLQLKTKFILDIRTLPIRSAGISGKIKKQLNAFSIQMGKFYFNGITVITPMLQQFISKRYHIDQQRIGIWMSGVDTHHFDPQKISIDPLQKSSNEFIVMYHGVLTENRGLIELINAMVIVQKQNPAILLNIVGNGSAYPELTKLTHQLKLEKSVSFYGPISYSEIPKYIARADIGILPLPDLWCWRVSSPLKLFEYLAMGKPVIVSPIEAHTSVLKNCAVGLFLPSTAPADIAATILNIYALKSQFISWGKEAREMVVNQFTWHHQAAKLENFLLNL